MGTSRLYLSFLGTNNYVPCIYYLGTKDFKNVRFVQEATIEIECRNWGPDDRIRIFTTKEAHKKNWLDGGHFSDHGEPLDGLKSCIGKLNLKASVKNVPIPDGKNETEFWSIFDKVFEEIHTGDEIVLDITHALRSIPLLANVVLNYAKVLKRISIRGIYYGAFEVLGPVEKVKQLPLEERRAPIFDLTAFDLLHDWALAIDRFLGAGDAVPACDLATRSVRPILTASKGQDKAAAGIKSIARGLRDLSQAISTCRGSRISEIATSLKRDMGSYGSLDLLPALRPLLDRVSERVILFQGDPVQDGIQAARWCLDHNLIQQGYTILNETLITHCLARIGGDPTNPRVRDLILYAAKAYGEDKQMSARDLELLEAMRVFFCNNQDLAKIMIGLSDRRNDLNHAGYRNNAMAPEKFASNLAGFLEKITRALGGIGKASGGS